MSGVNLRYLEDVRNNKTDSRLFLNEPIDFGGFSRKTFLAGMRIAFQGNESVNEIIFEEINPESVSLVLRGIVGAKNLFQVSIIGLSLSLESIQMIRKELPHVPGIRYLKVFHMHSASQAKEICKIILESTQLMYLELTDISPEAAHEIMKGFVKKNSLTLRLEDLTADALWVVWSALKQSTRSINLLLHESVPKAWKDKFLTLGNISVGDDFSESESEDDKMSDIEGEAKEEQDDDVDMESETPSSSALRGDLPYFVNTALCTSGALFAPVPKSELKMKDPQAEKLKKELMQEFLKIPGSQLADNKPPTGPSSSC